MKKHLELKYRKYESKISKFLVLLSSVEDFWLFNKRFCVGEGDGTGGGGCCDSGFSFGLGIVGDENELCTCLSVPSVLDTCCCNEFDAFLCIPNIVKANCVPIGGGFGDVVKFLFDVCCLCRCKSRLDVIIDFIKRDGALPIKSLLFSIKLEKNKYLS